MSHNSNDIPNLSDKRKALFELMMKEKKNSKKDILSQSIPKRQTTGLLPVSSSQQRLWFLEQMEPGCPAYNIPSAVKLSGKLNVKALQQSFNEIIRRHEALRTTFSVVDGLPVQVIAPQLELEIPVVDMRNILKSDQPDKVQQFIYEDNRKPYDLAKGPLIRATILMSSDDEHILVINLHHIISDGWTLQVLMRELGMAYEALATGKPLVLPELPIQYADYTIWQKDLMKGEVLKKQLDYWKGRLSGSKFVLELPIDGQRPPVQGFKGARQYMELSPKLTEALNDMSQKKGVTPFMILMTAFKILLYRYSGNDDVTVGIPIAGRNRTELEGLIGFFVNTLALRTDLSDNPTFNELLSRVSKGTQGAYDHQEMPFEVLVEELQPERDLSRNPIFQVCFSYQNETVPAMTIAGLTLTPVEIDSGTARFDMELQLWKAEDSIRGFIEYSTELFKKDTIVRMIEHFKMLLEGVVQGQDGPVARLPIMSNREVETIVHHWNNTAKDYDKNACIHHLFERQAAKTPDTVALVFENSSITYRELNERANCLAHYLKARGVGPEILVGICMERSIDMIVSLLGILKAGGAYIPLDPAYPKDRLAYMIEDSQMAMLVTQSSIKEMTSEYGVKSICVDTEWPQISVQSGENPQADVKPDNLAYIIYTSGSTGKPKGVQIIHKAVVNFLNSMEREPGITENDRLLSVTTLSFDIAVLEIFLPITTGACIVLASRDTATDGMKLIEKLTQHDITIMQATPATWRLLLESGWTGSNKLKILCGGEALPKELAAQLTPKVASLWNMYGPTETTIWSAVHKVDPAEEKILIGKPVDNTQIYILDEYLQPVPCGVTGELYIGGDGLSRGYLKRPELTGERFIQSPLTNEPGVLIYRTGDLARYMPDGKIEVLGRVDHQVKIRGFRIELGEIETVLSEHPAIREAAVAARELTAGDVRLIAYYIPEGESELSSSELRAFLKSDLPDYMLPSAYVVMNSLPLTPNGKLDRKALPNPQNMHAGREESYTAPSSDMERRIADIWKQVLKVDKVDKVGSDDNFFDLGGHSLLVAQVNSKLKELLKREINMIDMFKYPTVRSLAGFLDGADAGQDNVRLEMERAKARKEASKEDCRDIAVIGVALKVPGAKTPEEYWQNLVEGIESVSFFTDKEVLEAGVDPEMLKHPNFIKAEACIDNLEYFDAAFFGFGPREAEIMDPQLRYYLECSWEALERAGYDSEKYNGRIGVYGGSAASTYMFNNLTSEFSSYSVMTNYKQRVAVLSVNTNDFYSQRVSYSLKLNGPSVNVQTACSTSLVAVHMACQGLLNQECDIAISGGVQIRAPQKVGYIYEEGGLPSPDGHTRTFDEKAKGTIHANGIGLIVLKRLSDAVRDNDNIIAVIKGSAVNNDGNLKMGFTVPSVEGQARVIAEAQAVAGVSPDTVTYVEAFGTASEMGDPIEVEGLTQAFRLGTQEKEYCGIGAVKSNFGHLDHASGIAGLIKVALSLQNRMLPPTINFEKPSPKIDFDNSPFYVNSKLKEWDTDRLPRRAGVSSFAIGGTNVHVVLEEAPLVESGENSRPWKLLMFSSKTGSALKAYTSNLADYIKKNPMVNLADAAYTLQVGRRDFNHRRVVLCRGTEDAVDSLQSMNPSRVFSANQPALDRDVDFIFGRQGNQYVNMALDLYSNEPEFKMQVDQCFEILHNYTGRNLGTILYPEGSIDQAEALVLKQEDVAMQLTFVVEYALAKLWLSWGIHPKSVMGLGVGEYAAACLSGVFSLEDALLLLVCMSTSGKDLKTKADSIKLNPPRIPLISRKTGGWMTSEEALSLERWLEFSDNKEKDTEGLNVFLKSTDRVLLEISVGSTGVDYAGKKSEQMVVASLQGDSTACTDEEFLMMSLAKFWIAGVKIDWNGFYTGEKRKRIIVPTYPFERRRYWIESVKPKSAVEQAAATSEGNSGEARGAYFAPRNEVENDICKVWKDVLGKERIGIYDDFLGIGGNDMSATKVTNRLRELFRVEVSIIEVIESKNIANLTEVIEQKRTALAGEDELSDLLDEMDRLSEDEILKLLGAEGEE
jgi:amino acid adenylation domain-containing protein